MNFVRNAPNFARSFLYVGQTMFCMFFPWSLLPFWDITYAKKHIFLRPSSGDLLLNEKQKKPFVSLNHGVSIIHESPTTASLAQVAEALNGPDSSLFCPDVLMRWRSVQFFFLCRSLSLHFSKPKISIYLCVFVIESPFLIAWKGLGIVYYGLGWICLLAGIVTSTFGAQSIDYFHNTNSELTC